MEQEIRALRTELEELKAVFLPRIKVLEDRLAALEREAFEEIDGPGGATVAPVFAAPVAAVVPAELVRVLGAVDAARVVAIEAKPRDKRSDEEQLELEILQEKAELERLRHQKERLSMMLMETTETPTTNDSPKRSDPIPIHRALEQQEREEEESDHKRISEASPESPPDAEKMERRQRRNSGLRLSSAPSFGSSPQAELAASPQLGRSVRRSRLLKHNVDGRSSVGSDLSDGDDSDDSSEGTGSSAELEQKKLAFAEVANAYKKWADEALEDLSFDAFGTVLEDLLSFGEVLEESDKDIANPNAQKLDVAMSAWEQLQRVKPGVDGKPHTGLRPGDLSELHSAVVAAIEARRQKYSSRLREAQEKRAKEEEDRKAKQERDRKEKEAQELEEKERIEKQQKAVKDPNRISIDFDITKELAGLDFDFVTQMIPDKKKDAPRAHVPPAATATPTPIVAPVPVAAPSGSSVQALSDAIVPPLSAVSTSLPAGTVTATSPRRSASPRSGAGASATVSASSSVSPRSAATIFTPSPPPSGSATSPRAVEQPQQQQQQQGPAAATSPREELPVKVTTTTTKAQFDVGDIVEAIWDEDGQWYTAKLGQKTAYGFWLTFVEYGNSQDTAVQSIRAVGAGSAKQGASAGPAKANSGATKAAASGPGPKFSPASTMEPQKEDVRAPEGGIAARLAMLAAQSSQDQAEQKKPKRLSGLEDKKLSVKELGKTVGPIAIARPEPEKAEATLSPRKVVDAESPRKVLSPRKMIPDPPSDDDSDEDTPPLPPAAQKTSPRGASTTEIPLITSPRKALPSVPIPAGTTATATPSRSTTDDTVATPPVPPPVKPDALRKSDTSFSYAGAAAAKQEPTVTLASSPPPAATPASPVAPTAASMAPEVSVEAGSSAAPAAGEGDKVQKLKALREQLKLQRESGAAPASTSGSSGTPSAASASSSKLATAKTPPPVKKPESAASPTTAKKAVAADFEGLHGADPIPKLMNSDEIMALAPSCWHLEAPAAVIPVDVPARDKKRYEAVLAVLADERLYFEQLSLLMGLFYVPLRDYRATHGFEILSDEELKELFGNSTEIFGLHKLLLSSLTNVASKWTPENSIAPAMMLFAPCFKVYTLYTGQVGKAMVALTRFKTKHAKSKEFKQLVADAEADPRCEGTNLRSLLNVPVRRPAQYAPLLRAIQRVVVNKASDEVPLFDKVIDVIERK